MFFHSLLMTETDINSQRPDFAQIILFPFLFVLLLWLVKYYEWKTGTDFITWGLYPKKISGLIGILTAPLIHSDFNHLTSNTLPLLVLGGMVFYFYREVAWRVFLIVYVLGTAGAWFFARPSYHIGASGLVYGFVSFLLVSGLIRRNISLLALSMLVIFLYGGLVWGMIPFPTDLSWEMHLSGAVMGLICALIFRKLGPQATKYEWQDDNNDNENEQEPPGDETPDNGPAVQPTVTYIYKSDHENPL